MTREEAINKLHGLIYGVVDRRRIDDTCREVIEYLNEQEPVEPKKLMAKVKNGYRWRFYCGKCGGEIDRLDKHCRHCGKAVRWG